MTAGRDFSRIPATIESVNDDPGKKPSGKPSGPLPCPTSVSIGKLVPFNFSSLPPAAKENWRTYAGTVSLMQVGPGPDHRGHSLAEDVKEVSNDCPTLKPCRGGATLAINAHKNSGDVETGSLVTDSPTSTVDMHRTRSTDKSLLEGSGKNSCKVVCSQVYHCDDVTTGPLLTGAFTITREFRADQFTKSDGTKVHITTGTVNKTAAAAKAGTP